MHIDTAHLVFKLFEEARFTMATGLDKKDRRLAASEAKNTL